MHKRVFQTEMKKKFGRLVDLEELVSLMVNETVEELRTRLEGEQSLVDSERADRKVSQRRPGQRLRHAAGAGWETSTRAS